MIVQELEAISVPDSRGEETIAVFVKTPKGRVNASAPSGKSRGKYEVQPFSSKGMRFSISFLNMIGKKLISSRMSFRDFGDLEKLEQLIRQFDKSEDFSLLGGNALFALESAMLKAMAIESGKELWEFLNPDAKSLPRPLGNCIGGGLHAKTPVHSDMQEFLLSPKAGHFYDSYFINLQAYKELKKKLLENDKAWNGELTDEKAMASSLPTEYVLTMIKEVSEKLRQKYGFEIDLGIDMAASTLFNGKEYVYKNLPKKLNPEKQLEYVSSLIKENGLFYVEDPFNEEDFESFSKLLKISKMLGSKASGHAGNQKRFPSECMIAGDDLTATHVERLKKAIDMNSINAVIIKPNQNGSLLRTKEVVELAKKNSIVPVISHRSGETSDSTIADLAVAWDIPFIKAGILGKERLAKLNRLLKIERELGKK